jgi:hypothetical protein
MFLTALAVSLALGAGLLAAASYSEGTLIALRTAAQGIGWLLILATVVGITGLRQASFGRLGAATVAFLSGLAVLYVAYFEWGQALEAPIRHAAVEILPARELVYKATLASMPILMPDLAPERIARRQDPVAIASSQAAADPCASLTGVDSLQCRRCAEKLGVAWIVCQESARLEYCQGRQDDEATCPSAIPFSPPG